jgi:hypothetical protein
MKDTLRDSELSSKLLPSKVDISAVPQLVPEGLGVVILGETTTRMKISLRKGHEWPCTHGNAAGFCVKQVSRKTVNALVECHVIEKKYPYRTWLHDGIHEFAGSSQGG